MNLEICSNNGHFLQMRILTLIISDHKTCYNVQNLQNAVVRGSSSAKNLTRFCLLCNLRKMVKITLREQLLYPS